MSPFMRLFLIFSATVVYIFEKLDVKWNVMIGKQNNYQTICNITAFYTCISWEYWQKNLPDQPNQEIA